MRVCVCRLVREGRCRLRRIKIGTLELDWEIVSNPMLTLKMDWVRNMCVVV